MADTDKLDIPSRGLPAEYTYSETSGPNVDTKTLDYPSRGLPATYTYTTSGVLSFTRTHTTDALKRTPNTRTHTTDANKKKALTVEHFTDTNKRKALTKFHTTDSMFKVLAVVISLGGFTLPDPTQSRLVPLNKWGVLQSIGGKDRRDVLGYKYRYEIRWAFIKKEDFDLLETIVNTGTSQLLKYNRYSQSVSGVTVLPSLSERTHVALTGTDDFYSDVTLTATEVDSRL